MTAAMDRFDTSRPHPARVYDYLLGGKDNFAADREFGERMVVAVLDPSRPVAVSAIALLHYVLDSDDAYGIVARLMAGLPAGSCLIISHGTHDPLTPDRRARMEKLWASSPVPSQVRGQGQRPMLLATAVRRRQLRRSANRVGKPGSA